MPTYTVTAASGQLGRLIVDELLNSGVPAADVVAVVRTPTKAADLAQRGVEVREGDYDRPDSLRAALHDVDRLLLVSGSVPGVRVRQHTNVIDAARAAGVSRIVYTSIVNADDTTNPLAPEHQETEQVLRSAGVPVTLLRNDWYIENYTAQLGQYLEHGEIVGAAGDGRICGATRRDYAAAAVAALTADDAESHTYELGGAPFTLADLAREISDASGTTVTYRDLSSADYAELLRQSGLDEGTAGFVARLDASIAHGELYTDSDDLTRLLGRPVTSWAEAVRGAVREITTS